ncbi:NAD-dependent epimerase/dehydratase family protein [Enterococcus faecium]|nr:NAD-dependent epimerase/dehydratase family protein [Enterococcus faecium]MDW3709243.1 NAD-dependent epimerase/dehydratase family protein [Enterococcus faecium]
MNIYDNALYKEDIQKVAMLDIPWENFKNKSIMISGATGMIGSFLVDVIMYKNINENLNCTVYALGRNEQRAKTRFSYCYLEPTYRFIPYDINSPFEREDIGDVDYIIHLASNTHPVAYSTDPIGTITTNIIGTQNMLEFACCHNAKRCAFASSNEIYGENRGDVEKFDEKYCGYIDSNTMRAGYPESKRCGEALCQAYIRQKNLDIVIPRITRSYGPTLLKSDTKALSQFLHKGVVGENIVLKSDGTQYYSYLYVADTVSGLLTVLLKGQCGEAYNISDDASDIMLKDLATIIAEFAGKEVVFEVPDAIESAGYSKATKARLASDKINALGWKASYDINSGVVRTIEMLRQIEAV